MKLSEKLQNPNNLLNITDRELYTMCVAYHYVMEVDVVNEVFKDIKIDIRKLYTWAISNGYADQDKFNSYMNRVENGLSELQETLIGDKEYSIIKCEDSDSKDEIMQKYFKAISLLVEFILSDGRECLGALYNLLLDVEKWFVREGSDDKEGVDLMIEEAKKDLTDRIDSIEKLSKDNEDLEEYYHYDTVKLMKVL